MLRPVPDADALVAMVLAAADAQDRRYKRDGSVIVPRIPPADAHLCGFSRMDPEAHYQASSLGGRSRRNPDPPGAA